MSRPENTDAATTASQIYEAESRRVLATLIRLLGDFDLAEDALQEAFVAAVEKWPSEGVPDNPRAWLVSTGRFKAIDRLRRRARYDEKLDELADQLERDFAERDFVKPDVADDEDFEDDRLRLIFTCCHPALSHDAQVALTLREVCGLTTEEIARAFLVAAPTLAQRIVRAKRKIRDANIPYEVPEREHLDDRLDSVLNVIYLVFNEGYSASSGDAVTRPELSGEAIFLGRLLVELLPDAEAIGLLALMLLQESRREARTSPDGELVRLDDQDRSLWNRTLIEEGRELVARSLSGDVVGPYTIQAAIAAVHAEARDPSETDWNQIVGLYDVLLQATDSPVVALNRAVAVAMRDGAAAGLTLIDRLLEDGELGEYYLAHAARADFCRRLERTAEARSAYERALALVDQAPERRFLQQQLDTLD